MGERGREGVRDGQKEKAAQDETGEKSRLRKARGKSDDRMKIRRAGGWVEAWSGEKDGLLKGRKGGGFVLHPAGVWSSLAPVAPSSQFLSLNQEEQRYACY